MSSSVAKVYDERPEFQWRRLDTFPCEFHIHLTSLLEELPPGSRVLDVGAGPGRYAIELARAGHRVTVGDLSQSMVELAREHTAEAGFEVGEAAREEPDGTGGIDDILQLDACHLERFADQSFDAVVALGPFYHLAEAELRQLAAAEAARVLKPGGKLFAAFKPRTFWLSMALHTFVTGAEAPEAYLEHLEDFLNGGRLHKVKSPQLKRSWFCRVEDIEPFFAEAGVRRRRLLASSGVTAVWSSPGTWKRFADRDPEIRRRLLELVQRTSEDPHVLGMSDQVLFIGERDDAVPVP